MVGQSAPWTISQRYKGNVNNEITWHWLRNDTLMLTNVQTEVPKMMTADSLELQNTDRQTVSLEHTR